jgi:hypothetical protein
MFIPPGAEICSPGGDGKLPSGTDHPPELPRYSRHIRREEDSEHADDRVKTVAGREAPRHKLSAQRNPWMNSLDSTTRRKKIQAA